MRYVEQNPVRAGFVKAAEDSPWTSARAHVTGWDVPGLLDLAAWEEICAREEWQKVLQAAAAREERWALERATYGGKPFGGPSFRVRLERRVGRDLTLRGRGRPQ